MDSLHEKLRFARKQAGLSLPQAARLLDVRRHDLKRIEEGLQDLKEDSLGPFVETYQVSRDWLLGHTIDDEKLDQEVQLAAREIAEVRPEDHDKVLIFLKTVQR